MNQAVPDVIGYALGVSTVREMSYQAGFRKLVLGDGFPAHRQRIPR